MKSLNSISRRLFALLILSLTLLAATPTQNAAAQAHTVRLVIDYGDGTQKIFTDLPWSKGVTAFDIMNAAQNHPHKITFSYSGSGTTAFLTDIDGQGNEGGGAGKKNWLFWVNTSFADRSFGVYELMPMDVVTWRFAIYEGK
jgi:hypothetical protein